MEYAKLNGEIYLRVDPGEEILDAIIKTCEREKIYGGHFQGIGACGEITFRTYLPAEKISSYKNFTGLFEMVSLQGNVAYTDKINLHAHAMFSYLDENQNLASVDGHLSRAVVNYKAEIIIRPAGEIIGNRFDILPDNFGTWKFSHEKI